MEKQGDADTALQRTPEIRETESGNLNVRKDPAHTTKIAFPDTEKSGKASPEEILDPRRRGETPMVAENPHDILAVRRGVDDTDTPLE